MFPAPSLERSRGDRARNLARTQLKPFGKRSVNPFRGCEPVRVESLSPARGSLRNVRSIERDRDDGGSLFLRNPRPFAFDDDQIRHVLQASQELAVGKSAFLRSQNVVAGYV